MCTGNASPQDSSFDTAARWAQVTVAARQTNVSSIRALGATARNTNVSDHSAGRTCWGGEFLRGSRCTQYALLKNKLGRKITFPFREFLVCQRSASLVSPAYLCGSQRASERLAALPRPSLPFLALLRPPYLVLLERRIRSSVSELCCSLQTQLGAQLCVFTRMDGGRVSQHSSVVEIILQNFLCACVQARADWRVRITIVWQ